MSLHWCNVVTLSYSSNAVLACTYSGQCWFSRVEHWDVNNENLHGQWYQNRLNDPSYNLELFREAHQADPNVKLFLNDYNVVANWASTQVSHTETAAEQTTRRYTM